MKAKSYIGLVLVVLASIISIVILTIMVVRITQSIELSQSENRKLNEEVKKLKQKDNNLEKQVKTATASAALKRYFQAQGSILSIYSADFINAGNKYHIDPVLMASISMVESGGCRQYIVSTNNCFGWGSGLIVFPSIDQAIYSIADSLSNLQAYGDYKRTGTIEDFAKGYNFPYWQDYEKKISYFEGQIRSYE